MCPEIPIQITRVLPDEQAEGAPPGVHIQVPTTVIEKPKIGDYVLVLNTIMNTLRTLGVLTSDPLPRIC